MSAVATDRKQHCYHCGDDCASGPVIFDEKAFCCEGCRSVFQLLSENQLCTYYQMETTPGRSNKVDVRNERFLFLDAEEVKSRFIQFTDGHRTNAVFTVPQMHCASCIWLLENLHKLNSGIMHARVDFPKRLVTVSFDETQVKLSDVVALMSRIGYEPELRMEHLKEGKKRKSTDNLGLKIGLAGFAFGNIMLFSLPEYFTSAPIPGLLISVFSGLNIIISLPVLLYSAQEFFRSAYTGLKQGRVNIDLPIALGIVALYGRSLYEVFSGYGPGYFDSFAGLIFFLLLGRMAQRKTFNALSFDRDYASFFPISVARIQRDTHHEHIVPITDIKVGDTIRIRNQELVPADSVLMDESCQVDYSFVTGESDVVERLKGETVYAGGRLMGRQADMLVSKAISQSYLTSLWNNPVFTKPAKVHDFSEWTNNIAGWFTLAVMVISTTAAAYWYPVDSSVAIHVFISVLIVACPCALAMSAPFTLGASVNILSANGFFLKNVNVLERLASIKNIVFDKTGTLTELHRSGVTWSGREMTTRERAQVRAVVSHSTHPLSRALYTALEAEALIKGEQIQETEGRGISGLAEGAHIVVGSRGFLTEHRIDVPELVQANVYIAINGFFAAGFTPVGVFRSGMEAMVKGLKKQQLALHVVSGDGPRDERMLLALLGKETPLHFNRKPHEKLAELTAIQMSGSVAMIGDGLNDAGALKGSDVGIAVTDDVKSFTPASDAILSSRSLAKLASFVSFAKSARLIVWSSFGISFLYNVVGLSFAVTGNLTPLVSAVLMPVSSLTVIGFASGASVLAAYSKGLRSWKF
jgi:Cu+-exporting ATPase